MGDLFLLPAALATLLGARLTNAKTKNAAVAMTEGATVGASVQRQQALARLADGQCHHLQGATRQPHRGHGSSPRRAARVGHGGRPAQRDEGGRARRDSCGNQEPQGDERLHWWRRETLGVYTTPETFDPNTYEPVLEATSKHNYVELMAKKFGADSLNLYWRSVGTATWTMLSPKRARFPFHDDTPVPAGQTMQAREYMAIGVIADEEIDNPSNIASAVFQS